MLEDIRGTERQPYRDRTSPAIVMIPSDIKIFAIPLP